MGKSTKILHEVWFIGFMGIALIRQNMQFIVGNMFQSWRRWKQPMWLDKYKLMMFMKWSELHNCQAPSVWKRSLKFLMHRHRRTKVLKFFGETCSKLSRLEIGLNWHVEEVWGCEDLLQVKRLMLVKTWKKEPVMPRLKSFLRIAFSMRQFSIGLYYIFT